MVSIEDSLLLIARLDADIDKTPVYIKLNRVLDILYFGNKLKNQ